MAKHNEIGVYGEKIAEKWLINKGFVILDRNYRKKWGEIDIVARETGGIIHFIEVKAVSYETKVELEWSTSHNTWRPEENVHRNKQERLKRTILTWIVERKVKSNYQIDILAVRMVPREKYATIKAIFNVIFE